MEYRTFIASKEVVALTLCDLKQEEISGFSISYLVFADKETL